MDVLARLTLGFGWRPMARIIYRQVIA